jgi:hypothetical protein
MPTIGEKYFDDKTYWRCEHDDEIANCEYQKVGVDKNPLNE